MAAKRPNRRKDADAATEAIYYTKKYGGAPPPGSGNVYITDANTPVADGDMAVFDGTSGHYIRSGGAPGGGGGGGGTPMNLLLNGHFGIAQRQDPTVATHYDEHADRVYGPDRWGLTNENTDLIYNPEDRATAPEAGLQARYYGLFEKGSTGGKYAISQVVESDACFPHRGRTMTFQMDAKNGVNTHTLRMAVLSNGGGQNPDQVASTFISAWNGTGVDPTWGSLITAITPSACNANATIAGDGISCVLGSNWLRFSGQWVIPNDCVNIIVVIFTNSAASAAGTIAVSDVGLYDGSDEVDFTPLPVSTEMNALYRYYWKTFRPQDPPASNAGTHTNGALHYFNNLTGGVSGDSPSFNHPVPMRYKAPVGTLYNPHGSGAHVRNTTQSSDSSSETIHRDSVNSFYITLTGAFNWLPGDDIWSHIAFDAEI